MINSRDPQFSILIPNQEYSSLRVIELESKFWAFEHLACLYSSPLNESIKVIDDDSQNVGMKDWNIEKMMKVRLKMNVDILYRVTGVGIPR